MQDPSCIVLCKIPYHGRETLPWDLGELAERSESGLRALCRLAGGTGARAMGRSEWSAAPRRTGRGLDTVWRVEDEEYGFTGACGVYGVEMAKYQIDGAGICPLG